MSFVKVLIFCSFYEIEGSTAFFCLMFICGRAYHSMHFIIVTIYKNNLSTSVHRSPGENKPQANVPKKFDQANYVIFYHFKIV